MIINKYNYHKVLKQTEEKERALDRDKQILVELKTNAKAKSLPTIWVIWLWFHMVGGHRFYMHKGTAPLMLILTIIGILTCWLMGIGLLILLAVFIWDIVDACHLNQWVRVNRLQVKYDLVHKAETNQL